MLFVKMKEYIIVINAEQHCKAIAIFVTNVERGQNIVRFEHLWGNFIVFLGNTTYERILKIKRQSCSLTAPLNLGVDTSLFWRCYNFDIVFNWVDHFFWLYYRLSGIKILLSRFSHSDLWFYLLLKSYRGRCIFCTDVLCNLCLLHDLSPKRQKSCKKEWKIRWQNSDIDVK